MSFPQPFVLVLLPAPALHRDAPRHQTRISVRSKNGLGHDPAISRDDSEVSQMSLFLAFTLFRSLRLLSLSLISKEGSGYTFLTRRIEYLQGYDWHLDHGLQEHA